MPSFAVLIMAVAFALLCVEAPPKWAVTIILGVAFLIPDALKVPYAPHYLTVYRLVVWASALGLILRVSRREIPTSALRPGRVHLLLLALVGFAYFVGVAGQVAPATFSPSYNIWLNFVDQILLVISLVAFGRVVGARWVLTRAVWVAAVAAGIGCWEKVNHHSYARMWLEHNGVLFRSGPSAFLERRGGKVRVRAASEFALQFGWVMVILVPPAVAVAIRARRLIAFALPGLLVAAAVFTSSRSVYIGLVAGMLVMLVASRFERRLVLACIVGAAVGGILYLGPFGIREPFHGAPANSISSRTRRLLVVGDAVLPHPYTGLGLSGLDARGFTSTDDSYLLTYASLGLLGLALLGVTLLTPTIMAVNAAASDKDADDRLVAAAVAGGLVAALWSAASYDAFQLGQSTAELWVLGALAVVVADEVRTRRGPLRKAGPRPRPSPYRLLFPVGGVALGLSLSALASPGVASFSATNSLTATQISSENDSFSGQIIANTTCQAGHDAVKESNLNVGVICDLDISAPGAGILRISGPDTFTVDRALQVYDAGARAVNTGYTRTERERTVGKPTIPRTAPVWGGFLGALLAMLLPVFRRRRTPPEEVEPERVLVTV